MFGWFTVKCPVEAGMKRWIEARLGWLLGQFGKRRVLYSPMILPNEEYFPDPYDGSENAGRRLFERTCGYMNFDPARVELRFYRPEPVGRFNKKLVQIRPGWAGLYDAEEESQKIVWLDRDLLDDPHGLVATIAHELSHAILLGEKRLSRELPDMESITDLATVVQGLGIFNANVAFRTKNYTAMRMHYSSISSIGYLSPESFGYALALMAWLREVEETPAWVRYLDITVREPCEQGLKYLWKTNDASVVEGEPLDSICLEDLFPSVEKDSQELDRDKIYDAELHAAEESETHEDRMFADGYAFAEDGMWQEAVEAFSQVLANHPSDGEVYQERAWAYLELGRFEEALADAEKAFELLPEASEPLLARGIAYSQMRRFEAAISDLSAYLEEEDVFYGDGMSASKALYFRGLAFTGQQNFSRAIKDFSKAIIRWPCWPEPYEARAFAFEQLGEHKKAAADREEAERRREG